MYYYDEFGKEFKDELSFHEYLEKLMKGQNGSVHRHEA